MDFRGPIQTHMAFLARPRVWMATSCLVAAVSPHPLLRLPALLVGASLVIAYNSSYRMTVTATGLTALTLALASVGPAVTWGHQSGAYLGRVLAGLAVIIWAFLASRSVNLTWRPARGLTGTCVLAAAGAGLYLGPLLTPLAWRGDEDNHVYRALKLYQLWQQHPDLLLAGLLGAVIVGVTCRRWLGGESVLLVIGAGLASGTCLAGLGEVQGPTAPTRVVLLRYPMLGTLLHALPALCPWEAMWPGLQFNPAWFRLPPLILTLILGMAVYATPALTAVQGGLAAMALWTVPTVRYYATLSYPEILLCLAMILVLVSVRDLERSDTLPRDAGYLALLALAWMKPTVVPFMVVLSVHLVVRAIRLGQPPLRVLRAAGVMMIPVVLGLAWPGTTRSYSLAPAHLLPASLSASARLLVEAISEQYGLLVLLAAWGLASLWRRGHRGYALLNMALVVCYLLFFQLDSHSVQRSDGTVLPAFLGHSRFLLILLPPFGVLAWEAVVAGARRPNRFVAVGVIVTATNGLLTPVGVAGERAPFWGDYVASTSEFMYPYEEVLAALSAENGVTSLAVVGIDYPYFVEFYGRRHQANWVVGREEFRERSRDMAILPGDLGIQERASSLRRALQRRPDAVILHLAPLDRDSQWPLVLEERYELARQARLGQNRLILYRRQRGAEE